MCICIIKLKDALAMLGDDGTSDTVNDEYVPFLKVIKESVCG